MVLCRALALIIQFSSMPPQTKIDLYTGLTKYASEVVLKNVKMEARILALENELKRVQDKASYYKQ